jgi:hypothetical protein
MCYRRLSSHLEWGISPYGHHPQLDQPTHVSLWIGGLWTLERNLEGMGSSLQIHYIVSLIELLFDCWSWLDVVSIILSAAHFNGQHLLTSCVSTRSAWFSVLSLFGLQQLTPETDDLVFTNWWHQALQHIPKHHCKGFNSLVVLVDGVYGITGMVVCLKGHRTISSCKILEMRTHCRACRVPRAFSRLWPWAFCLVGRESHFIGLWRVLM